jgi:hypothetical protein
MKIKYLNQSLNIITNVSKHCKNPYQPEDSWNMTYFEMGSLNIIIYCNIFLGQIWVFPTFKWNIMKIF